MEFVEFIKDNIIIFTCTGGIIGYLSALFSRLSDKIDRTSEIHEARCDKLYQSFAESSERHEARCDKLYEMFIDLLKDKKNTAE